MSTYIYSSSPQIRSKRTTRQVMAEVCIALVPACIAGCILLGWGALLQLAIASISAVLAEFVYLLCYKKSFKEILDQFDFSSLVTGMLVGMNMYANSKWYVPMLASIFAIVVVKMLFGGTGKNIVNPAITGRIFAFISFGAAFGGTMYFVNESGNASKVLSPITGGYIQGATPLQALFGAQTGGNTLTNLDLFLGTGVPGCIGETCKLALIIGGIYLVVRGILNFRWPLVYILTTGVVAVLLVWYDKCAAFAEANGSVNSVMVGEYFTQAWGSFLPSILSGGLILGAVFMATDFVTTPNTKLGNYIYFVLLGIVTAVLRRAVKGEAVSFAILLMNLLVPLIDKFILRKPFGYVRPQRVKKEAK